MILILSILQAFKGDDDEEEEEVQAVTKATEKMKVDTKPKEEEVSLIRHSTEWLNKPSHFFKVIILNKGKIP